MTPSPAVFCVQDGDHGKDLMLENIMAFKARHSTGTFNDWLVQLSPEDITRAIMSSKQVWPPGR